MGGVGRGGGGFLGHEVDGFSVGYGFFGVFSKNAHRCFFFLFRVRKSSYSAIECQIIALSARS